MEFCLLQSRKIRDALITQPSTHRLCYSPIKANSFKDVSLTLKNEVVCGENFKNSEYFLPQFLCLNSIV